MRLVSNSWTYLTMHPKDLSHLALSDPLLMLEEINVNRNQVCTEVLSSPQFVSAEIIFLLGIYNSKFISGNAKYLTLG